MIFYNKKKNKNQNPKDIKFLKDLVSDATSDISDNTFCIFKSINDIFYLIYSTFDNSIISYNIIDYKRINKIKFAHKGKILNLKHNFEKKNNRDLLISMSNDNFLNHTIKLWNVNNFECLLELNNICGYLISSCILNDNDSLYIITNNSPIETIDLKGNIIKSFKNVDGGIYFIDTYNDDKNSKIYILTGHLGLVKSYDYYKNKVYHKYQDNNKEKKEHYCLVISNNESIIKLIDSCYDGYIRIWNFHKGLLLSKIKAGYGSIGICVWNTNYIFVGCGDNVIRLLELNKGYIVKRLTGHNKGVSCIKTINHPKYGECLISIEISVILNLSKIKLWVINNK